MFIVLLRFTAKREQAKQFMEGHSAWLKRGFDDAIFLLAGSLDSKQGGGIVAHNISFDALQRRVDDDPFVAGGIVTAEIIEIAPSKVDARLAFLVE